MGRPNRIVELELEDVVKHGLNESKSRPQILVMLNEELADRFSEEPRKPRAITLSALDRYLARCGQATVELAHTPQRAKENAGFAVNFEERFMDSLKRLDAMLTAFDDLLGIRQEDEDGEAVPRAERAVLVANLSAGQVNVLREHREHLKLFADLMERIHNAKQIERFQRTAMAVIGEAAPEVQREIERRMREDQDGRRAALLGMAT